MKLTVSEKDLLLRLLNEEVERNQTYTHRGGHIARSLSNYLDAKNLIKKTEDEKAQRVRV
jgi:hypothetical protein